MTKFSFEVPLKHLNDFDEDQDYHFCLSMLFDRPEYEEYHRQVRNKGLKTIWIDNSFNEKFEADKESDLIYLFNQFHATRVVAPDSIHWETDQIKKSFINISRHTSRRATILVCRNYKMYTDLQGLFPGTFAVSYWKRPGSQYAEWTTHQLQLVTGEANLHFLGLNSIQELLDVRPLSCDTSMPVKLALVNQTLRQWIENGCPHINTKDLGVHGSDFFNTTMTTQQIDLAKENIQCLRQLLTPNTTACVQF